MAVNISPEFYYVLVLFGLFVVPRILLRYGVPSAITSLVLGALVGFALTWLHDDSTITLLSTFGIVALFLFAGIEVSIRELRKEMSVLIQHVVIHVLSVAAFTAIAHVLLRLDVRPAALVALALLTPSAGFILESLDALGVSERERFWIRSKVIATELVALGALFVILRSATWSNLALSTLALVAMIALLPVIFRAFAKLIVPHAPKSEFAFLVMIAVACALVTRELGVYYLVGAFIVGMAARRFEQQLPSMASEKMLHAIEAFASLFVPFYFFHAGLELRAEDLQWRALVAGLAFTATAVPFRTGVMALHRRLALGESLQESSRVTVPMIPTLVFTLVIASILRDRFDAPAYVFGGLVFYALVNTSVPSFLHRIPPPEYEALETFPEAREQVVPRGVAGAGSGGGAINPERR